MQWLASIRIFSLFYSLVSIQEQSWASNVNPGTLGLYQIVKEDEAFINCILSGSHAIFIHAALRIKKPVCVL